MKRGIDYAAMFTLRKDGRYQKRMPDGKYLYDRDPKALYEKVNAVSKPHTASLRDVEEEWEREYRETITERTWLNMRPHVADIVESIGNKPITEVTGADIVRDLQYLKARDYSRTVVNMRKVIYNGILNYAVAHDYISINPAAGIPLPRGLKQGSRRAPTDEEIRKIISAMKPDDFSFYPFFLLCTGMRKSEALALTKADIDLKKKEIRVNKALTYLDNAHPRIKSPKTDSGFRTVPILGILVDPLTERMKHTDDILFPSEKSNRRAAGEYMSEKNFETAWKKYCADTGLDLTAHQLRHGTATLMFEAGVDMYSAKSILGHANIRTTMEIYTELREKQQAISTKKLSKYITSITKEKKQEGQKP